MKRVFYLFLICVFLLEAIFTIQSYAKNYTSSYFDITIPDSYNKVDSANTANQYSEDYANMKWNGGYVNVSVFVLKQKPKKQLTNSDVETEAKSIQNTLGKSVSCNFLHKDLLSVNGYQRKRITYYAKIDNNNSFYEDEYSFLSQNYIYCVSFTTDKKEFIDSSEQQSIINSLKIKDDIFVTIPFNDVSKSDWFYESVKYTYINKIISGYNETTFAPNDKLTRAMLVTILYRMDGSPNNDANSKFADVSTNEWYSKPIKWAVNNGIVHGYGGTNNFGPNDNIIRQDMVVIMRNYANFKKKDVNQTASLNQFSDYTTVDSYANIAMQWAVKTGVITGNANGTINPKGNATRAETAAMITKYCTKIGR